MENKELIKLLERLEIKYKNIDLYLEAFAHSSYINEHKDLGIDNYDRLEFLGDAVLGLMISTYLFESKKHMSAGDMSFYRSKVIRKNFLGNLSISLGFEKVIMLGNGGDKANISISIYEDVFESFIGAIYLDLGLVEVKKYLDKYFFVEVEHVSLEDLKDNKTKLQEHLQAEKRKPVVYELVNERRGSNNKIVFEVAAKVDGMVFGRGEGTTKKEAEQNAALEAYEKMVK